MKTKIMKSFLALIGCAALLAGCATSDQNQGGVGIAGQAAVQAGSNSSGGQGNAFDYDKGIGEVPQP